VGVVLNLAIWFSIHVIWRQVRVVDAGPVSLELPVLASIDVEAAALSICALIAVFRFKLGIPAVLTGAAGIGLLLRYG
jgi:chromate transporter